MERTVHYLTHVNWISFPQENVLIHEFVKEYGAVGLWECNVNFI